MERDETVIPGTQRVYFALWPDDSVRTSLALAAQRMHRVLYGRPASIRNIHLSLAFVGDIDIEKLDGLLALPAEVLTTGFRLTLDRWDCWSGNGIGWAGPLRIPVPLLQLVANLEAWLRSIGFHVEYRKFTPHVTLLRDAQCAAMPEPLAPIEWQVQDFVLVRSGLSNNAPRKIAARWPLS